MNIEIKGGSILSGTFLYHIFLFYFKFLYEIKLLNKQVTIPDFFLSISLFEFCVAALFISLIF